VSKYTEEQKSNVLELLSSGLSQRVVSSLTNVPKSTIADWAVESYTQAEQSEEGPKILVLDIETNFLRSATWALFKQNVGLNQILNDWYIIGFAAKWLGEDEIFYADKRDSWQNENDYQLCDQMWRLIDEADIVVAHNGRKFDMKKINARLLHHNFKPPRPVKVVDTLEIAKRHFAFTSNKLEYLTDKFCKVYKKSKHGQFPGFELWSQCMSGNPDAWEELEEYNIKDILSLEELYLRLRAWDNKHPNLNVYYQDNLIRCNCGSENLEHSGYWTTNLSKFDQFTCQECGAHVRGRVNLLSKDKQKSLNANIAS